MKKSLWIFACTINLVLAISILSSCNSIPQSEENQKEVAADSTITTQPIITPTAIIPTEYPYHRITEFTPELNAILPPKLAWDFYPNGLTRKDLRALLPVAEKRTGHIRQDEVWSGVIHITGDLQLNPGATLVIEPGTVILVAARSDDQKQGEIAEVDPYNPKDPYPNNAERIEFQVQGNLKINGTVSEPVIFTSDSENPQFDDWVGIIVSEASNTEISGMIYEFAMELAIDSSDFYLSKSIVRNLLRAINMRITRPGDTIEELLKFSPTITQNYIYNTGRHAVGITGSPEISHNVIIARYDRTMTGWEQGATGNDLPTCPNYHHNYMEGGMPAKYDDDIYGQYFPFTTPVGASFHGVCLNFEYNTVIGSPETLTSHPGNWKIEHNNIIPMPAKGDAEGYNYWGSDTLDVSCLRFYDFEPEPNDIMQIELIKQYGKAEIQEEIYARYNYWGTDDPGIIDQCILDEPLTHVIFEPYETDFIMEALPDWQNFAWE